MDIKLVYEDISPGAKETATFTTSQNKSFTTIQNIKQDNKYKHTHHPCELGQMALEIANVLDVNSSTYNGWWSNSLSNINGTLPTITLTISMPQKITTQGITIVYDEYIGSFAKNINIKWYDGGTLKSNKDFTTTSSNMFYSNQVVNFTKFVITFKDLNMPYNYLKIGKIQLGTVRTFKGEELQKMKLLQEISPLSREVTADRLTFNLLPENNIDYIFQSQQQMRLYKNDKLRASMYIVEGTGSYYYTIEAQSLISLLSHKKFKGGVYVNKNANVLIREILGDIPYKIDSELSNKTITGYIPFTNCRTALRDICFVIGGIVSTINTETIDIIQMDTTPKKDVPLNHITQYDKTIKPLKYTAIELTEYNYTLNTETLKKLYIADDDGTGNGIEVKLATPHANFSITNGDILEQNPNIVKINARTGCVLSGYAYTVTEKNHKKQNPNTNITDFEEIVSLNKNTLISKANVDEIINRIFNNLLKNVKINGIMDLEDIAYCGDYITANGNNSMITKAVYTFEGSRDIAEVELW